MTGMTGVTGDWSWVTVRSVWEEYIAVQCSTVEFMQWWLY